MFLRWDALQVQLKPCVQRHTSLHVPMFLQRLEMSQEQAILRTYTRLLPHLRENLGPAALVLAGVGVGGVLLGPVGAIPGKI